MQHQKAAVDSGQWLLYRYNPTLIARGENPLMLDSRTPKLPLEQYMYLENRFKMLTKIDPDEAKASARRGAAGRQDTLRPLPVSGRATLRRRVCRERCAGREACRAGDGTIGRSRPVGSGPAMTSAGPAAAGALVPAVGSAKPGLMKKKTPREVTHRSLTRYLGITLRTPLVPPHRRCLARWPRSNAWKTRAPRPWCSTRCLKSS